MIIVDNFSTDDTSKIVKSFKIKELNILNLKIKIIAALELGISKSKGKYLAFIDSDDKW